MTWKHVSAMAVAGAIAAGGAVLHSVNLLAMGWVVLGISFIFSSLEQN